jgi:hypothetical protein
MSFCCGEEPFQETASGTVLLEGSRGKGLATEVEMETPREHEIWLQGMNEGLDRRSGGRNSVGESWPQRWKWRIRWVGKTSFDASPLCVLESDAGGLETRTVEGGI